MNDSEIYLFWLGFKDWFMTRMRRRYSYARLRFVIMHPDGICAICGGYIPRRERTVDHIIPKSVCIEIGLAGLIYDPRNFQLAHSICNKVRATDMSMLPASIVKEIQRRKSLLQDVQA